jgi:hypothetical protein
MAEGRAAAIAVADRAALVIGEKQVGRPGGGLEDFGVGHA